MKTLILCFFIKRGKGAEEGGGGNQNKEIGIANISWGLHFNLITIHFKFLIKFKETKENRIDGGGEDEAKTF